MEIKQSRRQVLKSMVQFSGVIAGSFLVSPFMSCKRSRAELGNEGITAKAEDEDTCEPQELSQQEIQVRQSLKYVDQSPITHRTCLNCKVFTLPKQGFSCGGCKIVPGPIHKNGYCTAWIARI